MRRRRMKERLPLRSPYLILYKRGPDRTDLYALLRRYSGPLPTRTHKGRSTAHTTKLGGKWAKGVRACARGCIGADPQPTHANTGFSGTLTAPASSSMRVSIRQRRSEKTGLRVYV